MKTNTLKELANALKAGEATNRQILLVVSALSDECPKILKNEWFEAFKDDAGYVNNNKRR
jgi:hypothetical protein